MPYVDGFLLAVPKRKLQAYRRIAQRVRRQAHNLKFLQNVRARQQQTPPLKARVSMAHVAVGPHARP